MKKITKKEALVKCEKLWRWLEKHPSKIAKHEWAGWEEYTKLYGKSSALCPCCHYALHSHKRYSDCTKCPLLGLWGPNIDSFCLDSTSPYNKWGEASSPKTRKKYAKIIADECLVKLAELGGEVMKPLEWSELWAAMKTRPDEWTPTTEAMYWHILKAVFPMCMNPKSFLGGEPNHHDKDGKPVYAAFRKVGKTYEAKYLTLEQFKKEC